MLGRIFRDIIRQGTSAVAANGSVGAPVSGEVATQQVIQIDDTLCLVRSRHGWFLANRFDTYLGRALVRYGECSQIEHEFLRRCLRPGDNLIEVGANIGVHTVGLAKHVGPAGVVMAVEAQPAVFRTLNANLALNNLHNVITHSCGCGACKGTMYVPDINYAQTMEHNSGGVSLMTDNTGIPIQIEPLDEMVPNLTSLRMLKIDVEGMERDVLLGAARLIERCRPLLYVENDRISQSRSLIEWIMAAGYRLWWHTPLLFNANNWFGSNQNDYPNVASFNMICYPKESVADVVVGDLSGLAEIVDADTHLLKRP